MSLQLHRRCSHNNIVLAILWKYSCIKQEGYVIKENIVLVKSQRSQLGFKDGSLI